MYIITALDYLIQLKGIAQNELSEQLDVSKPNLNMWCTGKQNIPKKYIPILEQIFNVPSEFIVLKEITEVDKLEMQKEKLINEAEPEEHRFIDYAGNEQVSYGASKELKEKLRKIDLELDFQKFLQELKEDFQKLKENIDDEEKIKEAEIMMGIYGFANNIYKSGAIEPIRFIDILSAISDGYGSENPVYKDELTMKLVELFMVDKYGEKAKRKYAIMSTLKEDFENFEEYDEIEMRKYTIKKLSELTYLIANEAISQSLKKAFRSMDVQTLSLFVIFNELLMNENIDLNIIGSPLKAIQEVYNVKSEASYTENYNFKLTSEIIDLINKYKNDN